MTVKTKNFSLEGDPKLACTCGNEGCDKRVVKQYVLDMAQQVRSKRGVPMTVTSGGRCPLHEKEVHRDKPADHQKCQGIDFRVSNGIERGSIVAEGIAAGFNAIGVAKTFVHLGHRPNYPKGQIVMWTY